MRFTACATVYALRAGGRLSGALCTNACITVKGPCRSSMPASKGVKPCVIAYGPATASPLADQKAAFHFVRKMAQLVTFGWLPAFTLGRGLPPRSLRPSLAWIASINPCLP